MTSRIRLYAIPDLLQENNFIVEEIEVYLALFANVEEITGFQFQRLESLKRIKIDASQLNDTTRINGAPWNYVSIITEGDDQAKPAYYFIESVESRGRETISLSLKLDVLNTFYDRFKGEMTEATYIARAFRDRFFVANKTTLNCQLVSIFDKTPEGDNFPMVSDRDSRTVIYDNAGGDSDVAPLKFYLIYRTSNNGRPCLDLCANRELKIAAQSQGGDPVIYTHSDIVEGRYYYIIGKFSADLHTPPSTWETKTNGILKFWWDNANDRFHVIYVNAAGDVVASKYPDQIRITQGRRVYYSPESTLDTREIETFPYATINAGNYQGKYLGDISQLNKTDSRLVKVIECPYCPIEYSYNYSTGVYEFDRSLFSHESENEFPKYLRTYELGKELPERAIRAAVEFNFRTQLKKATIEAMKTEPRAAFLDDPKLFTSAYYSPVLVYDSFSKQIKFEELAVGSRYAAAGTYCETSIEITFKQSANISSACMFNAKTVPTSQGRFDYMRFKEGQDNFPFVLPASRNNEVALFSSEYLNYLKNGYNYEKKKREESLAFQGTMAGLQTLGAVLSFALSGATGGTSAVAGVGLTMGAATTFASMGMSAHQSGQEMEQKINLLKAQSYSVSGIDDLDLFNGYGGNKAQLNVYKLRHCDESKVAARFHYFGYAIDEYGDPNSLGFLDNRYNFNYLKADPVFRSGFIEQEYLDEIAERIRAGITIFHRRFYEIQGGDDYWLNRDFENIETSVVEAVEE